jgi:hypothetical protein
MSYSQFKRISYANVRRAPANDLSPWRTGEDQGEGIQNCDLLANAKPHPTLSLEKGEAKTCQ